MDKGGSHPCLELGGEPEHGLLRWAKKNTRRNGLVTIPKDEARQHLEDGGYIERDEESGRYRVVTPCTCEQGGNPPTSYDAVRRELMVSRSDGMSDPPSSGSVGVSLGGVLTGVKSKSVQKSVTTMYLAKYFFPKVMRAAGIQTFLTQTNVPGLAHQLNRWKNMGVDLLTMQLMMEEFAKHPEWCRRSRKPPWRVFVARQDELSTLVVSQRKKDPANRRWSTGGGDEYWLGRYAPSRHTPGAISPA